jgi:predicted amidohydrolase
MRKARSRGLGIAAVSAAYGRDLATCTVQIETTIRRAQARGAGLVVFPEAALGGYLYEPRDGEHVADVRPPSLPRHAEVFERLARAAGHTVVCVGYTEAAPGGPFSSAVCLSGEGVLGHHRKVHLPAGERGLLGPGDGFAAFDTPIGRLGMLICYDKVFPEATGALARQGAEIVASLAAWPVCRVTPARRVARDRQVRHFNALDVARAVENQVVWVSANQHGSLGRLRFPGQAKVVCPDGRVLAGTRARAGMALARLDVAATVRSARANFCHASDRVPEAYAVIPDAIESVA